MIWRPRTARTDLLQTHAFEFRDDRGTQIAAGAPLLSTYTQGRIALDVLDVDEALIQRLTEVCHGDIILKVDKLPPLLFQRCRRTPKGYESGGVIATRLRRRSRVSRSARCEIGRAHV